MSLLVQVHKDAKVEYGEAGRASFEDGGGNVADEYAETRSRTCSRPWRFTASAKNRTSISFLKKHVEDDWGNG